MLTRAFVLAPLLAASASAGQVAHTGSFGPLPLGGSSATTLPQFDPALGVLRRVRVEICPNMTGFVGYENTNAVPVTLDSPVHVGVTMNWSIGGFGYPTAGVEFFPPPTALAAYDGATDWMGTSGVTLNFTGAVSSGNPCPTLELDQDAHLDTYVGNGSVLALVGPVTAAGIHPHPTIAHTETMVVSGTLRVEYEFDAFPAVICVAQAGSGCPCGNFSPLAGGCGNSTGGFGAVLLATGAASIGNDTLTLHGSGMTNSNALYFQGTSFDHAQAVYGDGLRCVTGNVLRLGIRTNSSGASQVPAVGGTPLGTVGGIAAPGTRFYQVVYRDNGAFCTPSNFNATSGLAIAWTL